MNQAITPANITWQQDNSGRDIPISQDFGDVYFSRENGLAETQHTFLAGNRLAERLSQLKSHEVFTIGELGFGTGLNVLAVWQLWQKVKPCNHSRLHIITTEKYPLTKADLKRALAGWHELSDLSCQLMAQYPPLIAGCHRLCFPSTNDKNALFFDFSVDLWLGNASDSLAQVNAYTKVNAWFLDGFAPRYQQNINQQNISKQTDPKTNVNDDVNVYDNDGSLWANQVLAQVARLSDINTTVATFSVAGMIKRGLTAHGFQIAKIKGYGKKREMLTAHIPEIDLNKASRTETENHAKSQESKPYGKQHIAVIGAGVAGLCVAYAFACRGHRVSVIEKHNPLSGASGNPRAMLAPKLTPIHHVEQHLHSISYLFAGRYYQHMFAQTSDLIFEKTGVLDLLTQSNVNKDQINAYPDDFAQWCDADLATTKAGINIPASMYLSDAGLINPHALASAILAHHNIHLIHADIQTLTSDKSDKSDKKVTVHFHPVDIKADKSDTNVKSSATFNQAIICTAQDCHLLHQKLPKPRTTRGQINWCLTSALNKNKTLPKMPLKYGGYCTTFSDAGNALNDYTLNDTDLDTKSYFLLGASFIRGADNLTVNKTETQQNMDKFCQAMPTFNHDFGAVEWCGRASLRAQMPDYLPLVGQVDEHIFSLCALGSKGFAYAPICAEIICAKVLGETVPIPDALEKKLKPLRFGYASACDIKTDVSN